MTDEIELKLLHDRKAVSLLLGNDHIDMDLDLARDVHGRLGVLIERAESTTPPAPEPIDWSGEYGKNSDKVDKEWAYCMECNEKYHPCNISLGGYEVSIKKAEQLRDWLNRALEYHSNKWCKQEKNRG